MAADPQQVLRVLDIRGVHVHLKQGQLIGRMQLGSIPVDMVAFIKHNKSLIVTELQERERLAGTVTNVMSLEDTEYGEWIDELKAAPANDPHLPHDREAFQQARRLKQLAQWAAEDQEAA
jgi:hypothetical protein